jgi:hypothetical protein
MLVSFVVPILWDVFAIKKLIDKGEQLNYLVVILLNVGLHVKVLQRVEDLVQFYFNLALDFNLLSRSPIQ